MNRQNTLDRIQIVLVDPQDGANIGSVCRAMKTMGITHLAITGTASYDENRVRTLALHASDLWEHHTRYASLKDALNSSILSVAATRRRGKFRKASALNPEQLAQRIEQTGEGIISIVFGRESDGLTDEEVNLCNLVVSIPTSEAFPSLNLAQAVQIITYTLYNRMKPWPTGTIPVTAERVDVAAKLAADSLEEIGYYKTDEKVWMYRFLRDLYARASLTEGEIQRTEKLFAKIAKIKVHKTPEEHI